MKYPNLVPDRVCVTQCTIYQTDGLNRDGSPCTKKIFTGKCFYSEKSKTKLTAEKQLVTLSGEALFNGDIAPQSSTVSGNIMLNDALKRKIYASEKAKNPDGSVNYTRLELI